jgi:YVTN family beta-propeller protein
MIPISGRLREIVIDPCNTHIYVSNESMNQIEDYSIAAGALEAPIPVGSQPRGFDVTPDSGRLYVANMGGSNISVVDLATRRELRKINVPPGFSSDRPFSLAIASDGKALFSTTFAGSGFGGRMMSLDLDTDAVAMQTDFFAGGTTTEATYLKASMDRAAIAVVAGDISSAPVFLYRASTSAFSGEHDLNGFVSTVAVSSNGALVMVDGTYVLDGGLNLLGTIPGGGWAAFGPTGAVAYRASTGAIEILDTSRFRVLGTVPVADAMQGSIEGSSVGNMAVSSDGKWLAVITDHGIAVVDLP